MADTKPIDTGDKTVTGRTIWNDPETGEDYSERSTTFEIDGKFYPDVNGQAKVFKSFIDHKGVSVTKDPVRFNLNMLLKKI